MNDEVLDPHLTAKIVSSYVRHHTVAANQVSDLITSVYWALHCSRALSGSTVCRV